MVYKNSTLFTNSKYESLETRKQFVKQIYYLYCLLKDIISIMDSRFIGRFLFLIISILAIKEKLFTIFYLKIDFLIERVNQILE